MSKTGSTSSSKGPSTIKNSNKRKAQPITITVPDKLREDLKRYGEIKISTVCQEALRKAVTEEKNKKIDASLAKRAAMRLMKELKAPPSQNPDDYLDKCYQEGQSWAGDEAQLRELIEAFETPQPGDSKSTTNTGKMMIHFLNSECQLIPDEALNKSADSDHLLFYQFLDGAEDVWTEMKDLLEEQGYDINEVKESDKK
jgi:post-segregation antitoxin (ccd killing protein)